LKADLVCATIRNYFALLSSQYSLHSFAKSYSLCSTSRRCPSSDPFGAWCYSTPAHAMPTAKRLKSNTKAAKSNDTAPPRPTVADLEGESEFAQLAKKHWLRSTKRAAAVKVKNDVLNKDIWQVLEKDGFPYKSLLVIEGLQTLER
jgi:hypothetical protein